MSFRNYCDQLSSQTGIKAYIKKRIFNNLLKELIKQEKKVDYSDKIIRFQAKMIQEMDKALQEQKLLLVAQERLIKALIRYTMLPKSKTIKIIQLVPGLNYGDAIGNDVIALQKYLTGKGYDTGLYSPRIDNRLKNMGICCLPEMPEMQADDILLYHYSYCPKSMEKILCSSNCRKVMIYHNITPAFYFQNYRPEFAKEQNDRRIQLRSFNKTFTCCLADSEYNKEDLRKEGYNCPIEVLPILIPFEDYLEAPDETIIKRYTQNGMTNVLFVGRIVPNKKIEDVISAFLYYHVHINPNSRLIIVGSETMGGGYPSYLKTLVKENEMEEKIIFTGHVPFSALLAYYKLADVFLCMSEHEGFCVPLIEAMLFSVPVLAYAAAAIPETVGDAGIVINTKNPDVVASWLNRLVEDVSLRKSLCERMKKRIDFFSYKNTTKKLDEYLTNILMLK